MADGDATLWVGTSAEVGQRAHAARPKVTATVWPLEALARSLAASGPAPRRTLDAPGAVLAVALATHEGAVLSALDVERSQGWADAVHEARTGRVRARVLAEVAERVGGAAGERLQGVARALAAYEGLLRRRGLADDSGRWDDARAAVAALQAWPEVLERFSAIHVRLHPPVAPVVLETLVARTGPPGRADGARPPLRGARHRRGHAGRRRRAPFVAFEAHLRARPSSCSGRCRLPGGAAGRGRGKPRSAGCSAGASARLLLGPRGGAAADEVAHQARLAAAGRRLAGALCHPRPGRRGCGGCGRGARRGGAGGGCVPRPDAGRHGGGPGGRAGRTPSRRGVPRTGGGLASLEWPPSPASVRRRRGARGRCSSGPACATRRSAGAEWPGAYRVRLEAMARREARAPRGAEARALVLAAEALFAVLGALPTQGRVVHAPSGLAARARGARLLERARRRRPSGGPGGRRRLAASSAGRCRAGRRGGRSWRGARGALAALGSAGPMLHRAGFAAWLSAAACAHRLPREPGRPGGVSLLLYEEGVERGDFTRLGALGLAEGRFPRPLLRAGALTDDDRYAVNRALGRDAFPLRYGSADVRPPAALALDGWRLGVALGRAQAASLGFARDDGFQEVGGPAALPRGLRPGSACVERVDFLTRLPCRPCPGWPRSSSFGRRWQDRHPPRGGGGERALSRAGAGGGLAPRGPHARGHGRGAGARLRGAFLAERPLQRRGDGGSRFNRCWHSATPMAPRRPCPPARSGNSAAAPSRASSTPPCAWSSRSLRARHWTLAARAASGTRCWRASCRASQRLDFSGGPSGKSRRPCWRRPWTPAPSP